MHCPHCRHRDTAVIDSRLAENGRAVRRRRTCAKCRHRFTTFERQEMSAIIVIKRDGAREPFNREKLERSIWVACTKRHVTHEQVERILNKLEAKWASNKKEVATSTIGNDVMKALQRLDKVSYIRFASVHREFKDVEEFQKELSKMV